MHDQILEAYQGLTRIIENHFTKYDRQIDEQEAIKAINAASPIIIHHTIPPAQFDGLSHDHVIAVLSYVCGGHGALKMHGNQRIDLHEEVNHLRPNQVAPVYYIPSNNHSKLPSFAQRIDGIFEKEWIKWPGQKLFDLEAFYNHPQLELLQYADDYKLKRQLKKLKDIEATLKRESGFRNKTFPTLYSIAEFMQSPFF